MGQLIQMVSFHYNSEQGEALVLLLFFMFITRPRSTYKLIIRLEFRACLLKTDMPGIFS
jgi:hypothetical protein